MNKDEKPYLVWYERSNISIKKQTIQYTALSSIRRGISENSVLRYDTVITDNGTFADEIRYMNALPSKTMGDQFK